MELVGFLKSIIIKLREFFCELLVMLCCGILWECLMRMNFLECYLEVVQSGIFGTYNLIFFCKFQNPENIKILNTLISNHPIQFQLTFTIRLNAISSHRDIAKLMCMIMLRSRLFHNDGKCNLMNATF